MCDRNKLADVAREEAERPYNGKSDNCASNIQDIAALFPQWSVEEANGLWCAAFVYHCVILAGFKIPVRPKESSCSLAGCAAWEEWAQATAALSIIVGMTKLFILWLGMLFFLTGYSTTQIMTILELYLKIMIIIL